MTPMIFAQTEIDIVKAVEEHDWSWAVAALVVWLLWRYVPRAMDGHISFMETCRSALDKLAEAFTRLSERDDSGKTNRAIGHVINAAKKATDNPDVHRHLEMATDELNRQ